MAPLLHRAAITIHIYNRQTARQTSYYMETGISDHSACSGPLVRQRALWATFAICCDWLATVPQSCWWLVSSLLWHYCWVSATRSRWNWFLTGMRF